VTKLFVVVVGEIRWELAEGWLEEESGRWWEVFVLVARVQQLRAVVEEWKDGVEREDAQWRVEE
jgi:hypothetical protein